MNATLGIFDAHSLSNLLRHARQAAGLTLRELAHRAGTSHSTIAAYEAQRKMPSLPVVERLLQACNVDSISISLVRRVREKDGIPRGEELEQALALAEQFPARHAKHIEFPGFSLNE